LCFIAVVPSRFFFVDFLHFVQYICTISIQEAEKWNL
jgi:hypothetical protein